METAYHADGDVLKVQVTEGEDKPYSCSAGFFTRVGPTSEKLSRRDIVSIAVAGGRIRFDEQLRTDFRWPRDLDREKIRRFVQRSGLRRIPPLDAFVENLGLGVRQRNGMVVNNACALLFAKEPRRFIRHNVVTCVRYHGITKYEVMDRKDFSGDLISNYDNMAFLKQYTAVRYIIKTSRRQEVRDIPEAVLREALLNAIVHCDYFDNRRGVMVDVFDDRVMISNPGSVPEAVKQRFGELSAPRNPHLFDIFHRAELVEKVGSGIARMKEDLKQAGLPEPEFSLNEIFVLVLRKGGGGEVGEQLGEGLGEGLGERLGERLGEKERRLLEIIRMRPTVTQTQLSRELGISTTAIEKCCAKLKQRGLLRRIGPARGGHWEIVL